MESRCGICGARLEDDLFAYVTSEEVCCICKVKYIGGLPTTKERINEVREGLGLVPGEFLTQDNPKEASRILRKEA